MAAAHAAAAICRPVWAPQSCNIDLLGLTPQAKYLSRLRALDRMPRNPEPVLPIFFVRPSRMHIDGHTLPARDTRAPQGGLELRARFVV